MENVTYLIEVSKLTLVEGEKYSKDEVIYKQLVETLDLKKVIDAINSNE